MKKILVPTDFSPSARNAGDYAVSFARVMEAKLQLVHVYRDIKPVSVGDEPWSMGATELQLDNEKNLNHEIDYYKEKHGVEVAGDLKVGFKGDTINELSEHTGIDLIIMGMKERKKSNIFGNTTLKIIRKTTTPVLIIPEGVAYRPVKNIVLAVDFEEMTESRSFDVLYDIVQKNNASLRVLHVIKRGSEIKASEMSEKLQLARVLYRFTYEYDEIESNDADKGIGIFVENYSADMLVMLAHRHNIFERMFGSLHTAKIGQAINLPLLVLKGRM